MKCDFFWPQKKIKKERKDERKGSNKKIAGMHLYQQSKMDSNINGNNTMRSQAKLFGIFYITQRIAVSWINMNHRVRCSNGVVKCTSKCVHVCVWTNKQQKKWDDVKHRKCWETVASFHWQWHFSWVLLTFHKYKMKFLILMTWMLMSKSKEWNIFEDVIEIVDENLFVVVVVRRI